MENKKKSLCSYLPTANSSPLFRSKRWSSPSTSSSSLRVPLCTPVGLRSLLLSVSLSISFLDHLVVYASVTVRFTARRFPKRRPFVSFTCRCSRDSPARSEETSAVSPDGRRWFLGFLLASGEHKFLIFPSLCEMGDREDWHIYVL